MSLASFCTREFPKVWESFVHAFTDASHAQGPAASRPSEKVEVPPAVLPAVPRLVAVGDLHGDLHKARRAFQIAGLIDERDRWVGGTTTVVQVGDILDRGDQELQLLFWLERLQRQAAQAGGAVHVLNGNHETMNVAGHFRYATLGGLLGFSNWAKTRATEVALKGKCPCEFGASALPAAAAALRAPADVRSARVEALRPGGEVTRRFLARFPTVLQVGSTLFVHGGLLPHHAELGLERINRETQAWMLGGGEGAAAGKPDFLSGRKAVVWARHYSAEDAERCDCHSLAEALRRVPGAQRMVVGHTIQAAGINSACEGRVYRIDVGMSKGCTDGAPEVLEILHDSQVRRITEPPTAASAAGAAAKEGAALKAAEAAQQQRQQAAAAG